MALELKDNKSGGLLNKLNKDIQQVDEKFQPKTVPFDQIYTDGGESLGYVSRYPTYSPTRDNEQHFAERQGGWDKVTNGVGQMWMLGKNTFANHFRGYGRALDAMTSGDWNEMWDTGFGEETAKAVKAAQDYYPLYETKEQREAKQEGGAAAAFGQYLPYSGNATNAWSRLLGQFGFTAGVMGAVGAETVGLTGLTAFTGGTGGGVAAAKSALNLSKLKNMKSFYNLVRETRGFASLGRPAAKQTASKIGKLANSDVVTSARMGMAASGEASIEANFSRNEFIQDQIQQYEEKYGTEPPESFKNEVINQSEKVGNNQFNWNLPVLMAGNMATIGNLFKPKNLKRAAKVSNKAQGEIAEQSPVLSTKSAIRKKFANYPKIRKGIRFAQKGAKTAQVSLGEGTEELMQGVGDAVAQNKHSMFESEVGKGTTEFVSSAMEETYETLQTREGWNEFAAGALTGFGIKGITSGVERITGKKQAEKDAIRKGVKDITDANSRYLRVLSQLNREHAVQKNVNENNIKEAKDNVRDAEIALFNDLDRYGVADEYLDELHNNIKKFAEENPNEAQDLLQDRNIDDVVNNVKTKYRQYQDNYKKLSKQIGNPYDEGTSENAAWDTALRIASGFDIHAQDSFERAEDLQKELSDKYGLDEEVLSSALDPTTLQEKRLDIEDYVKQRKESLENEMLSQEEIQKRKNEIAESETKLNQLKALEETYYDKNGNLKEPNEKQNEEAVNAILQGAFNEGVRSSPAELKQDLEDMMALEDDGFEYRNLYNLLSNREYFDAYGEAFVNRYLKKAKEIRNRVDEAIEPQGTQETQEGYTQQEFEDEVQTAEGNASGEAINQMQAIQRDKFSLEEEEGQESEVSLDENGNFTYNGNTYEDTAEGRRQLFDQMIKDQEADETEISKTTSGGETVRDAMFKRFNQAIDDFKEQADEDRNIRNHQPNQQDSNDNYDKQKPKTKTAVKKEKSAFVARGNNTLIHYFDKLIAKIWPKEHSPLSRLKKNLERIGDTETFDKIKEAYDELGAETDITTLYLADENIVFGERTQEQVNQSENIRVITDGIRYFILTKNLSDKSASDIINEELGLSIEQVGQNVVVRNQKGEELTSPFKIREGFNVDNEAAIHTTEKGDKLILQVTDNEYNNELFQNEDNNTIANKLHISVYNQDGVRVGILRAGDFLFEAETNPTVQQFRQYLNRKIENNDISLDEFLGEIEANGVSTARNKNFQNGELQFTNISNFNPAGYQISFYYVNDEGQMQDEDGNVIENPQSIHDRGNFNPNAIYMKMQKPNGVNHTVQLYRQDSDDSSFTEEEFRDGSFREVAQTHLDPNNPILSKRVIAKLTVNEQITQQENKKQALKDQYKSITKKDNGTKDVIIYDGNGNVTIATNAVIENDMLKSDQGDYLLADLSEINSFEEITITSTQVPAVGTMQLAAQEWTDVRTQDNNTIENWLLNNGVIGVQYEMPDGTVLQIQHKQEDAVLYSVNKNGFIYYVGLNRNGQRKEVIVQDGNTQLRGQGKLETRQAILVPDERRTVSEEYTVDEEGSNEQKARQNKAQINLSILQNLRETLSLLGVGEEIFNKMKNAYDESVRQGNPIQSLQQLMEAANLTEHEKDAFNFVVTPVFYNRVWSFITQSETFFTEKADEQWNKFKTGLREPLDELENVDPATTPPDKYNEHVQDIFDRIKEVFKSSGISITNLPNPTLTSVSTLKDIANSIKSALEPDNIRQGIQNLFTNLQKFNLSVQAKGLMFVNQVDRKSLGRQPIRAFGNNSIYMDLSMTNVEGDMYVRNERDGNFVKMKPTKQKVDQNIWKFRKDLVSLTGINIPVKLLKAYYDLNGDFNGLKQRALVQKSRQPKTTGITVIQDNQVTSEERHQKYYKIVKTPVRASAVELNNVSYNFLMETGKGEYIYIKDGEALSSQQFSNIAQDFNITKNIPKRMANLSSRVESVKDLQKRIDELENCG